MFENVEKKIVSNKMSAAKLDGLALQTLLLYMQLPYWWKKVHEFQISFRQRIFRFRGFLNTFHIK